MQTSPSVKKTGGGTFDPAEKNIYFLASNTDRQQWSVADNEYILLAVNELRAAGSVELMESWLNMGKRVFLDSGIFTLAMNHARAHGTPHNEALNLAPEAIDGFQELFDEYVRVVRLYGESLWGYVELDQGGRENKIRTRAKLESMGLKPIPVYHPLGDGWDYFDELAEQYDRICLGNVVQASTTERLRLLATIFERKQKYPHLWIHALGVTPNQIVYAYPMESCDSSSWLHGIRWSGQLERSCGLTLGHLPQSFQYVLGSDPASSIGSQKAVKLAAYCERMHLDNWRHFEQTYRGDEE